MADQEQLQSLKQGVAAWHAWRFQRWHIRPGFSSADLHEACEPTPPVFGVPEPGLLGGCCGAPWLA